MRNYFIKHRGLIHVMAAVFMGLVLSACAVALKGSTGNREPDIAAWEKTDKSVMFRAYTEQALDRLGRDLMSSVPGDISTYCPSYTVSSYEERKQFWAGLVSTLAYFESGQSTQVSFQEAMHDVNGKPVISRGLLQISRESANAYGCNIGDESELHDPQTNIYCGVRILTRWVAHKDGVIADQTGWFLFDGSWLGAARYWSPFRNPSKRNQIARATRRQSYCL